MQHNTVFKEQGQSVPEYALLLAAVAVVVVLILVLLGVNVGGVYCQAARGIGVTSAPGCPTETAAAASGDEWSDDFSGGGSGGAWTYDGKKPWDSSHGQLCGAVGDGTGTTRMFADGTEGKNYTIVTHATLNAGNGYGIFFRATGKTEPPTGNSFQNGYTFQYDPGLGGKFVFRKWVNGYELNPPFASTAPPKDFQWNGRQREIQIDVHGSSFSASIDGKKILTAHDKSFDSGYVGLRIWDGTSACFDDISVKFKNDKEDD